MHNSVQQPIHPHTHLHTHPPTNPPTHLLDHLQSHTRIHLPAHLRELPSHQPPNHTLLHLPSHTYPAAQQTTYLTIWTYRPLPPADCLCSDLLFLFTPLDIWQNDGSLCHRTIHTRARARARQCKTRTHRAMSRAEFEPKTEDRTRLVASNNFMRTNRNMNKATAFTSSICWSKGRANWGSLTWRIMLQCYNACYRNGWEDMD